jgi:hypothetical protein
MRALFNWTGLVVVIGLLSACSQEKVVIMPPPEPAPPPIVISPLITLENAHPIIKGKRGPVGTNIDFVNSSEGVYQFILFRTTAYDDAGNIVRARKSRDHSAYLRVAGPIMPGQRSLGNAWKNTWAKHSVQCVDIDSVEIVFSDGSVEVASGQTLAKLNSTCAMNTASTTQ